MAKKKKFVTKDTGVNVNTTFSANQTTPTNSNVVPTPSVGTSTGITMGWPSPALFYQQGKDAAKKIYTEYLNTVNQYQNDETKEYEPRMQAAGKMNSLIQSMIQGVALGTEAAESIQQRLRTGDESARIEMEVVKDTLSKLLKTIWVHNTAAKSGKFAGLEVKLLEPSLTTRVRQSTGLETTDYGIALNSEEEADTIWVDQMMPSEQVPFLEEKPVDELGQVSAEGEPTDEDTALNDATLDPQMEEEIPNGSEESPLPPTEEEDVVNPEDIFSEDATTEEVPIDENGNPIEEEIPTNEGEVVDEEVSLDENGNPIEEIPTNEGEVVEQPQEDIEEPVDEEGLPLPTGPEGTYTREDLIKYGEMIMGEMGSTEEEPPVENEGQLGDVPSNEGEVIETPEEEIPTTDDTTEIPEDDETIYCIVCDREVDKNDIANCEREDCPFKDQKKEEDVIEVEDDEEINPDENWFDKKKEPDKKDKHYVMMDSNDHSNHNVKAIIIKEFTDLEGDYCLDCQKTVSFNFDQKTWSSEDAKNWVNKHIKNNEIKNKSPEKIIQETIDKIPETVLKEWVEEKTEVKDSVDFLPDNVEEIISNVIGRCLNDKFNNSPLAKRLKDLEA